MSRKQLPVRIESRRKSVLARRTADIAKHESAGNKDKAEKAKLEVNALRKKLNIT